jgi:hypothetical protein
MRLSKVPLPFTLLLATLLPLGSVQGTTIVGPWVPMFKGIDHSVSTNLPSTSSPRRMVIHTLRVDLTDPDLQFITTPRATNYVARSHETGGLTVIDFLKATHVQVAINANRFNPQQYYLPAYTPMDVLGEAVDRGVQVSAEDDPQNCASMYFDANNQASMIASNWPPVAVAGAYTAVSGTYPILVNGRNIAHGYEKLSDFIFDVNPRTVFGLSADRRYLYLVTIDGRQPGYSDGCYDYEAADWLILLGASDAINMDGGGSTTLVIQEATGFPRSLNHSSAVADSGNERTVGSHFGIFAKPLPGFINDVSVAPQDTGAQISWTTTDPASSQVQYGPTQAVSNSTPLDPSLVAQHSAQLAGLTPNTGYYFEILASTATNQYTSSMFYFVTTNYVTTNQVFDLSQNWRFSSAPRTSLDWTAPGFDDSNWGGPGPGLLWVDVRSTGPNPAVDPKTTQMPFDPSTGYPYVTYYFRTHFTVTNLVPSTSLSFIGYIDDGAIVYLNGTEIYRLRMPSGSVTAQTLANGYPCSGDATCPDLFGASGAALVSGDNVVSAEVHNYNAQSPDITFGLYLDLVVPQARSTRLQVNLSNNSITLSWDGTGYTLQSAASLSGPWLDIGQASSPFVTAASDSSRYYRLRQ